MACNKIDYLLVVYRFSVVPRVRHCRISVILPPMSLKNAPSAGLRAHLEKSAYFFAVYYHFGFSVT